jgi:8-oxo-dGTP pyrophosphatase MutT (NUDIX family)
LVPEAGAIAVRHGGREPLVLLVTSRRNPVHWVFPKGHIEPGESAGDAALRELREEAGVVGTLGSEVGKSRFRFGADELDVTYFLIRAVSDGQVGEGRSKAWLSFEEAARRASFDDARGLLQRAQRLLQEMK